MFNVNIDTIKPIIDEDLNNFYDNLKIDYDAFYRGVVVDNLDPERLGRVRVRIPQLYGTDNNTNIFSANSAIPWATCAINMAGNDSGTFLPPNIGDTVFVTFEGGDYNHPIYFGGIFTNRKDDTTSKGVASPEVYGGEIMPVITDDLPLEVVDGTERVIYKSLKGAIIYIDDKDGYESIRIIDQSGQSIIMENLSGEPTKRRGNYIGKNPNSHLVLTNNAGDSLAITQGQINIKSKNIVLETDNFRQVDYDLSEEIDEANNILGVSDESIKYNVTFIFKNDFNAIAKVGVTPPVEHTYFDLPETAKCYIDIFDKDYKKIIHKEFIGDTIVIPLEDGYYYYNAGTDIGNLFASIGDIKNSANDLTGETVVETRLEVHSDMETLVLLQPLDDPVPWNYYTPYNGVTYIFRASIPPYDDVTNYGPPYYSPVMLTYLDKDFNPLIPGKSQTSSGGSDFHIPRRPYRIKVEHPAFETLVTPYMFLGGSSSISSQALYLKPLEPHPDNGGNL